jgi:hypothetical protein
MADLLDENVKVPAQPPLTTQELAAVSAEVAAFFPQPFERTELVLLVIDPRNVHAYWHVRNDDMARAAAAAGQDAPLVLRMYDITYIDFGRARPHGYFDLQVHWLQNSWYIGLWEDAKSYIADLGLRRRDGSLVALARSNVIETPRAGQSPRYERAGVRLGPNGRVERVPDITAAAPPANGVLPRRGMPADQVRRMVGQFYRRFWPNGKTAAPSSAARDGGRR